MEYNVKTEQDMQALVVQLLPDIREKKAVLFEGDLGSGKSFFIREYLRVLTGNPALNVPSPTYTLIQEYEFENKKIYHFDLYRLEDPEEIFELGWEEALAEGQVLVEWPSRLGPYMPSEYCQITIEKTGETTRKLTILDKT